MSDSNIPEESKFVANASYDDSPDRIGFFYNTNPSANFADADFYADLSGMVKSEMTADFATGIKIGNHYSEPTGSTDLFIPSNVSAFSNDAGYLTLATLPPDMDTDVTALTLTLDGANNLTAAVFENGNTIPSAPVSLAGLKQTLTVTKKPLYRYEAVTAEESGGAADNSSQWSTGNGATGFIGVPINDGWEVTDLSFHADFGGSAGESMQVHLVDMRTPSVAAPIIATLNIVGAGDGVDNNAYIFTEFASPIAIPNGAVLGFRTGDEVGTWSDMRIRAGIRKEIDEFVSDVSIS